MSKKAKNGVILNKFGNEKPTQKMVRLFHKQRSKVEKRAKQGDHSQYVRNAIDAYDGE
jgi:hypothetical protein